MWLPSWNLTNDLTCVACGGPRSRYCATRCRSCYIARAEESLPVAEPPLTAFEEQLAKLRAGKVRLVSNVKPRAPVTQTLAGVPSGW